MKALQALLVIGLLLGGTLMVGCGEATEPGDGTAELSSSLESVSYETARTKDQKDIAYRVVGTGAQDIVLVHGWMMTGAVYDNLVEELASDDYRLIIPDLRGGGDSDKPNGGYSLQNYLKDIEAVIEDSGADDYVLAGHSMGGALAQRYAAQKGDGMAGLVLMSPVPASGFPLPPDVYALFSGAATDPALKDVIVTISSVDLDPADFANMSAAANTVTPKAVQQSLDAWTGADFEDMLSQIDVPTKVLVSDDPFMTAPFLQAFVADLIAGATVTYIPGGGHYLQVEIPAETAAEIDAFVSSL